MIRKARKDTVNIVEPAAYAKFDERELRRHVDGADNCKWLLEDSGKKKLATEGLAKENFRSGSCSPESETSLYQNDTVTVLLRQVTRRLSQDVDISLQDVPKHFGHSVAALQWRGEEKRVREKLKGSARRVL